MFKTKVVVLVAVVLTGCASHKVETETAQVVWHKMNANDISIQCTDGDLHSPIAHIVRACYRVYNNVCHVYSQDNPEHMVYFGHEVKHCFDGLFHDTNGKWYPAGTTAEQVRYMQADFINPPIK